MFPHVVSFSVAPGAGCLFLYQGLHPLPFGPVAESSSLYMKKRAKALIYRAQARCFFMQAGSLFNLNFKKIAFTR